MIPKSGLFLAPSTCPAATDPRQFTKRLRLAQFGKLPPASSFISQYDDRIYAHRAACGNRARHQRNACQQSHDPCQHHRIVGPDPVDLARSEEHTSELQSQSNLVCRLLLEKKKTNNLLLRSRHSPPTVPVLLPAWPRYGLCHRLCHARCGLSPTQYHCRARTRSRDLPASFY